MLFSLWVSCIIVSVDGWSAPGHRLVAKQASHMLAESTVGFLHAHLHGDMSSIPRELPRVDRVGEAMAEVSTWSDGIVDSREYHYTHTGYRACKKFNCPSGRCLPTGIARFMKEAADIHSSGFKRAEAIKHLIHLVADATQPFHTGFKNDVGGLFLPITSPIATSLHRFWDKDLVDYALEAGMSLTSKIDRIPDSDLDPVKASEWIVTDTIEKVTCNKAYVDIKGFWIKSRSTLSLDYLEDRAAVAMLQLSKASVFLTQILDKVANDFMKAREQQRLISHVHPVVVPMEAVEEVENDAIAQPIVRTTTPTPHSFGDLDLGRFSVTVDKDLIDVSYKDGESEIMRQVELRCIFKDRLSEIYRIHIDMGSWPSESVDHDLVEAVLTLHLGRTVDLLMHFELWSIVSSKAAELGVTVSETKQGDDIELKKRPENDVYTGSSQYVVAAFTAEFAVALINTDQSNWTRFRFNWYYHPANQNGNALLLLIQSTETDEVDVMDHFEFLVLTAHLDEFGLERSREILDSNPALRRSLLFANDLVIERTRPIVVPSCLSQITRIDRTRDKPWLETIEIEIDPKGNVIDVSDVVVTHFYDGILGTTRKLIAEDANASEISFIKLPSQPGLTDMYIDSRIVALDADSDVLANLGLNDVMKLFVNLQTLTGGRGARAIKELDGMLKGNGRKKRSVVEKYKKYQNGEIIIASLYPVEDVKK